MIEPEEMFRQMHPERVCTCSCGCNNILEEEDDESWCKDCENGKHYDDGTGMSADEKAWL